jgi:hypothetical protein
MRKKAPDERRGRSASGEKSESLKTFFIYALAVLILVIFSLSAKAFSILQKSKVDGQHNFILAVEKEGRIGRIISFKPNDKSLSVLHIKNGDLTTSLLGKNLGLIPDGVLVSDTDDDVDEMLISSLLNYASIKTDLTIIDIPRLIFFSKNVPSESRVVKDLVLPKGDSDIDRVVANFGEDRAIVSEYIDIHIINASDVPGMATRLERVISNLGGNVVKVSTAHGKNSSSKIEYAGEKKYTIKKLNKLLGFPIVQVDNPGFADVVITIGVDNSGSASRF